MRDKAPVPTTLLIEEGFVIGHHSEILQALSILRGFGHRMTIVFQSLQQIKNLYPDTWGLFMGGAVLGFRPGDLETAEWMSKRAADEFRPSPVYAEPASPADRGVKPSWQPQKRDRIRVGRMFGMPPGRALVWLPNDEAPRVSWVSGYFDIPELAARADPNPYYTAPPTPPERRRLGLAAAAIVASFAAAGVALWPSGARLSEGSAAGVSMHDRLESSRHPVAPRTKQAAARRTVTQAIGGFHE